jgi:hypothetical protein
LAYLGNRPAEAYSAFQKQDFSTSATTSYTLDHPVSNQNEIALFINFVRQEPTAAYTASGTTLTLTSATASSDDMYCVYLGKAVQTVNPPNGSVGSSQVAASIITGQTAETSIATDDTVLIHDTSAGALKKMTRANFVSGVGGTNTPYFAVRKSSDQSLTHNNSTKITFDTTDIESSSNVFDLTNNKFTATVAGKYCFQTQCYSYDSDNNLKRFDIYLYKNNSGYRKSTFFMANGDIRESVLNICWIENVAVNDYFELYAFGQTTDSGNFNIEGGSNFQTTFSGFKLVE